MTVTVETQPCVVCGKTTILTVSREGLERWQAGAYIQDAFPELDKVERETLISGTHGPCWEILWNEPEVGVL